ncbi:hypothetical protein [Blastococcus sp. SYSU DS0619]
MTRLTRNRVAATTGLTALASVSLGLAFAPAALAAPAAPTAPSTVVVGEKFTVSGVDCAATKTTKPAIVYVDVVAAADVDDLTAEPVISVAGEADGGSWSTVLEFPSTAAPGEYVAFAICEPYDGGESEDGTDWLLYPEFSLALKAAPVTSTPTPTPAPETPAPQAWGPETPAPVNPAPSAIRGVSANTPGVAAQTTTATTKTAVAGEKVVKVYKGFQAYEWVTLTMHSTPQVLGTFQADADGVLTAEFTLAEGTEAGTHTLVLEGPNTYFQESFEVAAASSGSLAYTGASVGLPLALGAGLLVVGGGALVATRRRSGASQA